MVRVAWPIILSLLTAWFLSAAMGDKSLEAEEDDAQPVGDLLLEVDALQFFYQLQLTREQLAYVQELAKETVQQPAGRPPEVKVSAEFRKTLMELREALVANKDEERIDDLNEKLDDLRKSEKLEFNDDFEMTDAAREQAPRLLRKLSPAQLAGYLGTLEDMPDPLEEIVAGLDKVRSLKEKQWKEYREVLADQTGRLVVGLDPEKASACGDKVIQLLIVARSLSDEEFPKRRPELEKKARTIVGDIGPLEVLQHEMEFRLAELLSNPRLLAATGARLK
jgi:hypothetical protein